MPIGDIPFKQPQSAGNAGNSSPAIKSAESLRSESVLVLTNGAPLERENSTQIALVVGPGRSGRTTVIAHLAIYLHRLQSAGLAPPALMIDTAGNHDLEAAMHAVNQRLPASTEVALRPPVAHNVWKRVHPGKPLPSGQAVVIDTGATTNNWNHWSARASLIVCCLADDTSPADATAFAKTVDRLALDRPRLLVVSRTSTAPFPIDHSEIANRFASSKPVATNEIPRWDPVASYLRAGWSVWDWPAEQMGAPPAGQLEIADTMAAFCGVIAERLLGIARPTREHVRDYLWRHMGRPDVPVLPRRAFREEVQRESPMTSEPPPAQPTERPLRPPRVEFVEVAGGSGGAGRRSRERGPARDEALNLRSFAISLPLSDIAYLDKIRKRDGLPTQVAVIRQVLDGAMRLLAEDPDLYKEAYWPSDVPRTEPRRRFTIQLGRRHQAAWLVIRNWRFRPHTSSEALRQAITLHRDHRL